MVISCKSEGMVVPGARSVMIALMTAQLSLFAGSWVMIMPPVGPGHILELLSEAQAENEISISTLKFTFK